MKKASILFAFILATFAGFAQGGWTKPSNSHGTIQNGISTDSALAMPAGCGAPSTIASINKYTKPIKKPNKYMDTCAHVEYSYDPARDAWDSIHLGSIAGAVPKSIAGVVGGGGADDPTSNATTYVNAKLVGLGPRITIVVNNVQYTNFGANANITFTPGTGTIDISPNKWIVGGSLFINLNQ